MISVGQVFEAVLNFSLIPLKMILMPVDYFLANIPGLNAIPEALQAVSGYVGKIPETVVALIGINPVLWNAAIAVLLGYFAVVPAVNGIKKLINWARG